MASIRIDTPKEFSFQQCLHFLNRSANELLHVTTEDRVEKLICIEDEVILFSISEPLKGKLKIHFPFVTPSAKAKLAIKEYISEWFDLKTDLRPFYTLAGEDEILKPLVKRYYGYRIVSMPDLFESLCWAVIGQQINLSFAYLLKRRFVELAGECIRHDNRAYYLFPAPEQVMHIRPQQLLDLQFSRQKVQYVIGIAKSFVEGELSKERLQQLSYEDAKNELLKIKGIGSWTANYALMKTFHYPNAFPLGDAGLHQALRKQWKLNQKPMLAEIEKHFKKYKGWEAYATLYLWRSLSDH